MPGRKAQASGASQLTWNFVEWNTAHATFEGVLTLGLSGDTKGAFAAEIHNTAGGLLARRDKIYNLTGAPAAAVALLEDVIGKAILDCHAEIGWERAPGPDLAAIATVGGFLNLRADRREAAHFVAEVRTSAGALLQGQGYIEDFHEAQQRAEHLAREHLRLLLGRLPCNSTQPLLPGARDLLTALVAGARLLRYRGDRADHWYLEWPNIAEPARRTEGVARRADPEALLRAGYLREVEQAAGSPSARHFATCYALGPVGQARLMLAPPESLSARSPLYPGHAIVVACQIACSYPSLGAALRTNRHGHPDAAGNNAIDGAGGNVYAALHCLEELRGGQTLDSVLAAADETWLALCTEEERPYGQLGCQQARAYLKQVDLVGWAQQDIPIES